MHQEAMSGKRCLCTANMAVWCCRLGGRFRVGKGCKWVRLGRYWGRLQTLAGTL